MVGWLTIFGTAYNQAVNGSRNGSESSAPAPGECSQRLRASSRHPVALVQGARLRSQGQLSPMSVPAGGGFTGITNASGPVVSVGVPSVWESQEIVVVTGRA